MIFEASNAKLKQHFYPRKFGISASKTHIFGAPQSGKTSLALNFAKNFKNPLYIDFVDLRNSRDLIKQTLLKSAMEKKNDFLVLDNLPRDFALFPAVGNILAISDENFRLENFAQLEILPLNFEEFIAQDSSHLSLNQLLEQFIKFGNLPSILPLRDFQKLEAKQKMLVNILGENMDIFLALLRFQSSKVSIFQLYNILKKTSKMSKNRLYSVISDFTKRGILRSVAHLSKPNAPKKAYFFDFSAKSALSYERDFMAVFENMVFLEILGREHCAKNPREIFYSDKIPLICGNQCFFTMPFKSKEMIAGSLKNIDFLGFAPFVITLDLNDSLRVNGQTVQIQSFINFALD